MATPPGLKFLNEPSVVGEEAPGANSRIAFPYVALTITFPFASTAMLLPDGAPPVSAPPLLKPAMSVTWLITTLGTLCAPAIAAQAHRTRRVTRIAHAPASLRTMF